MIPMGESVHQIRVKNTKLETIPTKTGTQTDCYSFYFWLNHRFCEVEETKTTKKKKKKKKNSFNYLRLKLRYKNAINALT